MLARLERSTGKVDLSFKLRDGETVLGDLYQQGCGKARLGRKEPEQLLEAILINTSGGLTDGDCITTGVKWEDNTCAVVTTQAAERFYKALAGKAILETRLEIGQNACGLWLPQETIMFDSAAYERTTKVELGTNALMVALKPVFLGDWR